MNIETLQEYANQHLDGLYDPDFPHEAQCSGWHILLKMVKFDIKPFMNEKTTNLYGLHENLRSGIISNWDNIKKLKYE
jgi:hypothetical protein